MSAQHGSDTRRFCVALHDGLHALREHLFDEEERDAELAAAADATTDEEDGNDGLGEADLDFDEFGNEFEEDEDGLY